MAAVLIHPRARSALLAYLDWAGKQPWEWGKRDCTLFAADWARHLDGYKRDPAAGIRGTYDDADSGAQIIAAHGGIVALGHRFLTPLGWEAVENPVDGDIGIVEAPTAGGMKLLPALRFGPMWSVRSVFGVRTTRLPHVAAWRLDPVLWWGYV
ncbi:DUF6950 family protein [Tianweitania sp.]|uniref:DUF6950 family protein n=1 Tax=Tianweitania sp. TaxID=2021634 RepID=UPI00289A9B98|nr:hypothetical protein [Tianweitania sp.]